MPDIIDPQQTLARMSLAEKVGQVFVFTWRNAVQAANDLRLHPGGYIMIYSDAITVARESAGIQAQSNIPLIMAADFERGIGGTVNGPIEVVSAMALGAAGDETASFDAGQIIGRESLSMGINMDYAPVLDVNCNPRNPVINTRSFGADADLVARIGVAFTRGLQSVGVAACGKHFPGHGNTHVDSHSNLGTANGSRAELEAMELRPFRAAITAGVDAIMSAHLLVPGIEPEPVPATLSKRIMTGLLREELGFNGVVVSDALDMGAIAKNFPPELSIPMALNAGCDQLIMPNNNALVVDILMAAVRRGEVSEKRLNEAVLRNLTLKQRRGILDRTANAVNDKLCMEVNRSDHRARVQEIADSSIAIVRDDARVPLKPETRVLYLEIGTPLPERSYYLEPRSFADCLEHEAFKVTRRPVAMPYSDDAEKDARNWVEKVSADLDDHDIVVLGIFAGIRLNSGTVGVPAANLELLNRVAGLSVLQTGGNVDRTAKPVVVASFGSPYAVNQFPGAGTALCAFSETQASQRAMARALSGAITCRGNLPVNL